MGSELVEAKEVKLRGMTWNPAPGEALPRWLIAEAGLELPKGAANIGSVEEELRASTEGELSQYLGSWGERPYWHNKRTHYHSKQLREVAKGMDLHTKDGQHLLLAAADDLDSLHRTLHQRGSGRIEVEGWNKVLEYALALRAAQVGKASKPKPPWGPGA